jgi:GH25 family lysozyme M1 (1,4-beta-N-acetylmuramidase)
VLLNYGGDDITELLFTLLNRANFPYSGVDLSQWQDFRMIEKLKESMIVLSEVSPQFSSSGSHSIEHRLSFSIH